MKILVVDDDAVCLTTTRLILEKSGHSVLTSENGVSGLKLLKRNKDCKTVIIDISMPEMNGLEVAKNIVINDRGLYPEVTIIIMSSEQSEAVQQMGRLAGIEHWLIKPVTPDKILAVLDEAHTNLS